MLSFIHLFIQEMFNTTLTERIEKSNRQIAALKKRGKSGMESNTQSKLSALLRLYIVSSSKKLYHVSFL